MPERSLRGSRRATRIAAARLNYRLDRGRVAKDLHPLFCFAVSAERYVLFNLDDRGRPSRGVRAWLVARRRCRMIHVVHERNWVACQESYRRQAGGYLEHRAARPQATALPKLARVPCMFGVSATPLTIRETLGASPKHD